MLFWHGFFWAIGYWLLAVAQGKKLPRDKAQWKKLARAKAQWKKLARAKAQLKKLPRDKGFEDLCFQLVAVGLRLLDKSSSFDLCFVLDIDKARLSAVSYRGT